MTPKMKADCQLCAVRDVLILAEWDLFSATNSGNVHRLSNVRAIIMGSLELVRYGMGNCEHCNMALEKIETAGIKPRGV